METQTLVVEVNILVSNIPKNMEPTNTISINLQQTIEELIEDESGIIRRTESSWAPNSHFSFKPLNVTPRHISQLLDDHQVPYSRHFYQEIAHGINNSLSSSDSIKEPILASVDIRLIKEFRTVLLPRSVSGKVFQRLVEEQRVESMDLIEEEEENICSICIENLSNEINGNIIKLPRCLHMFHQVCLFEWLSRKMSCPLCRRVPYEEDQETETQRLT